MDEIFFKEWVYFVKIFSFWSLLIELENYIVTQVESGVFLRDYRLKLA
jgi:hypothetical protein